MSSTIRTVWLSSLLLSLITTTSAGYAPIVNCDNQVPPSVRPGTAISNDEASYVEGRLTAATKPFQRWLQGINSEFEIDKTPVIGLTSSGGGYRALLCGAGVVQALDSRDSNTTISGLYQALTYHSGLSGGSWLLSSIAGNNWPTISNLVNTYWDPVLPINPIDPGSGNPNWDEIATMVGVDVALKLAVAEWDSIPGLTLTMTDLWGRFLSWSMLPAGSDLPGDFGASLRFSDLTTFSNFTSFNAPYPIITALGVDRYDNQTTPGVNGTQYEFTPHEFGAWNQGISAFTNTSNLGSIMSSGSSTTCVTNADNLGYILGISSTLFNNGSICPPGATTGFCGWFEWAVAKLKWLGITSNLMYAHYNNPFLNYQGSPAVNTDEQLWFVDGGESEQNNPIWPLIQPSRNVSVLIVNDNTADTGGFVKGGYPDGTQLYNTYIQAQAAIPRLEKMPYIPPKTRIDQPTVFGCDEPNAITIIYLPNNDFTYPSGTPTIEMVYTPAQIAGIIGNGNAVANNNGTADWPLCFACAVTAKQEGKKPEGCFGCREKYCYLGPKVEG